MVDKAVEIYQKHFFGNTFVDCLTIIPGAQELLTKLAKNYKLAIATGAHPKIIKDVTLLEPELEKFAKA